MQEQAYDGCISAHCLPLIGPRRRYTSTTRGALWALLALAWRRRRRQNSTPISSRWFPTSGGLGTLLFDVPYLSLYHCRKVYKTSPTAPRPFIVSCKPPHLISRHLTLQCFSYPFISTRHGPSSPLSPSSPFPDPFILRSPLCLTPAPRFGHLSPA